jgi:glycosyltransferase involved in cell wall biosynthesis
MQSTKDISVVIPVFNGSGSLKELNERLNTALIDMNVSYEIIYVDDCSKDMSWKVLKEIHSLYSQVMVIKLARNFGQHNATICGMNEAKGKTIITMDDDLEHPPESIKDLYDNFIIQDRDIFYALPTKRKKSFLRNMLSRSWIGMTKLSSKGTGKASSFRVLKKEMADHLALHNEPFVFIESVLFNYTENIGYKEISYDKRKSGKSNYSFIKLVFLQQDVSLNYSTVMLSYMMTLGSLTSYVSYILIVYYLMKKILGNPMHGYTSLIVVLLFSTGSVLKAIGYLGLYIGKMFRILNKEPQYNIAIKLENAHTTKNDVPI